MSDAHPHTASLLVADDDPDDVHLLVAALEHLRTPVILQTAASGPECLRLLRDSHPLPDLLLLDLKMPGMSGLEVLDAIRSDDRTAHLSVIVLSGSERDADRSESLARGADAYLVKPTGLPALYAMAEMLERDWFPRAPHRDGARPTPKAP